MPKIVARLKVVTVILAIPALNVLQPSPLYAAFIYSDFSDTTGLGLNGTTAAVVTADGSVLRLTTASATEQSGTAYTTSMMNAEDFSTLFTFRITNPGGMADDTGEDGGDGLAFALQSLGPSQAGGPGGGIGYGGTLFSVGIEFDTWRQNNGWVDPSSNHIGIDITGAMDSVTTVSVSPNFDDGSIWYSWIDYDGTTLEVRASETGARPASPLLSFVIDIPSYLAGSDAFVGFTSGTAGAYANHDILSWAYRDFYGPFSVPEPSSFLLLGTGLLGVLGVARRRKIQDK